MAKKELEVNETKVIIKKGGLETNGKQKKNKQNLI